MLLLLRMLLMMMPVKYFVNKPQLLPSCSPGQKPMRRGVGLAGRSAAAALMMIMLMLMLMMMMVMVMLLMLLLMMPEIFREQHGGVASPAAGPGQRSWSMKVVMGRASLS